MEQTYGCCVVVPIVLQVAAWVVILRSSILLAPVVTGVVDEVEVTVTQRPFVH